MTATAAAATSRPAKPRPSLAVPIGVASFLAITYWAASREFGIAFDLAAIVRDATRGAGIIGEVLSPDWSFLPATVEPMLETIQMAIIASVIGCSIALPVSFIASRVTTPGPALYRGSRAVLNVIRALPDLLYAMIFVAAVSIGPLAGILALVFFDLGVVAKLLSETVDGVDRGPMEAARAGGATGTLTVRSAVLPQILPNYVAYSLYVFELNIRASTIIGIVGAGGIGNVLNTQMKFFAYEKVGVVIAELFVLVLVIELISIQLRRRLV